MLVCAAAATLHLLFSRPPISLTAKLIFPRVAAEYFENFEFRKRNMVKNEIIGHRHAWSAR